MKCPACGEDQAYPSRNRSFREAFVTILLPIQFRRCHACRWRGMRPQLHWRKLLESVGSLALGFLLCYTLLVFLKVIR